MHIFAVRKAGAVFLLSLLTLASLSNAEVISINLQFQSPVITETDGFHSVALPGASNIGDPGVPSLPTAGMWALLPPGEMADYAELRGEIWHKITGQYRIEPNRPPQKISDPELHTVEPDQSIYGGIDIYPAQPISDLVTHLKRGYSLATCLVSPLRWNPEDGSLELLVSAELVIHSSAGERETTGFSRFYRGDPKTLNWVESRISNPEMVHRYPRRDDAVEPEGMLVVTVNDFFDLAEDYAAWRESRGMRTHISTCETMLDEQNGVDDQDCIRNGIIEAYEDLNIGYVLILGDTEQVPHRGLWAIVNNSPDRDIPADMYYGALDGDWNDNNDEDWGRGNEADLTAELYVGRFAAGTAAEISRSIHKVQLYSDEPVVDDILDILMIGEELGWQNTGGDYMDEVYPGSNRNGYSTVGYPERFNRRNLYDRDRVWDAGDDLAPLMSSGHHMINHLGHANTRAVMKFGAGGLNNNLIRNDGVENGFNIAWSQGCYAGAYDNRNTEPGDYVGDCIGETFVSKVDNGMVAFICNSRYGWGDGGGTDGASQRFHRFFVDAIFDDNATIIGETNQNSKEDCIPWANQGVIRWCYYEINLLGDPAMDIWTDEPGEVEAEFDHAIVIGDETYQVTIEGVAGATVSLSRENELMYVVATDEDGVANFEFDELLAPPGPITLTIIAHDFMPYSVEIQSILSDHGFPWVGNLEITDRDGIEDDQADPGETLYIIPPVRNLGRVALEGLTISLESDDPFVNITRSETTYPEIESDEEGVPEEPLVLILSQNCPDLHEVNLTLLFEDAEGESWSQNISFTTHAPIFGQQYLTIMDDDENNNGRLDPGEEAYIAFSLTNLGTGRAGNLTAVLDTENPMIELIEVESTLEIFEPNTLADFEQLFLVRISDDCPDLYNAVVYVRVTGDRGAGRPYLNNFILGGDFYAFDRGEDMWEHERMQGGDYLDMWHLSENLNHSFNGSRSLKVGSLDPAEEYPPLLDCAVYMPEFEVNTPLQLVFWHKLDAEVSRANPGQCYDGGFVEISIDDGDWELIFPETVFDTPQYPYTIRHGQDDNNHPLPVDQWCYSGTYDWQPAIFDLSDFEGSTVEIRFRFGSDRATGGLGWWIDDISLQIPIDHEPPTGLAGELRAEGVFLTWNSPIMRDEDIIYPDELLGYRIYRIGQGWDLLDTLITNNEYFDALIGEPEGSYRYMLTAEYVDGESDPSDAIEIEWEPRSVRGKDDPMPESWEISSAWPNPFNSTARIAYSVPVAGDVNISLFDIHGRLAGEFAKGGHTPGRYEITFTANGLSSGVYIVRMQTPVGFKMTRMVLIK